MANWEKFLASSLRVKVLGPTILVMAVLLALTVFIVDEVFRHQFEVSARERLRDADQGFRTAEILQRLELERRFKSLSHEPRYHAIFRNYHELDTRSISNHLRWMFVDENLTNDGVVTLFFTPVGKTRTNFTDTIVRETCLPVAPAKLREIALPATALALKGETGYDTVRIENQILNLVSVPVLSEPGSNPHEVIGALTFGKLLDKDTAKTSFRTAGLHGYVAFIAGNQVSRASLNDASIKDADLIALFQRLSARGDSASALEEIQLEQKHFYCTSGTFRSLNRDGSIGYLLFTKYQEQLDALADTRNRMIVASLLAMLGGALLIMFFVWRALRPLEALRLGAEAVGRGDFTRRVVVSSNDECGQLAKVFNRMTADVEHTQTQLRHTVETLQTMQAQLIQSEKLSAVGEFVAGVAHELNNPLAAVMGFSEILKNAPVEPEYQRHLQMIFKSAERCQKIVHSLLTFARRHQPERLPVSVNKLIEEVLEIVAYQLRTDNIAVVRDFHPNLPPVLGDGHQIQQVIINLINNARQAMENQPGDGKLFIATEADGVDVRIRIADNGPGISPENLQKIFDPFFTTKEVGKGTGLGLSLCYGLIKEHGGNISVKSQLGHGATFTVELPAALSVPAGFVPTLVENSDPKISEANEGQGKTILVVDDEEMLLSLAEAELSANGYDVVTANNGEKALSEVAARKIDAVLCDLKMPGLNGRQVLQRLREIKPELAGHFAFVTGDIINESLAEFFDREKVLWLNKPFALSELRGIVKSIAHEPGCAAR